MNLLNINFWLWFQYFELYYINLKKILTVYLYILHYTFLYQNSENYFIFFKYKYSFQI